MAEPVYKLIELVGTSETSISAAIENAISYQPAECLTLGSMVGRLVSL